jgi:hypothetical protein
MGIVPVEVELKTVEHEGNVLLGLLIDPMVAGMAAMAIPKPLMKA